MKLRRRAYYASVSLLIALSVASCDRNKGGAKGESISRAEVVKLIAGFEKKNLFKKKLEKKFGDRGYEFQLGYSSLGEGDIVSGLRHGPSYLRCSGITTVEEAKKFDLELKKFIGTKKFREFEVYYEIAEVQEKGSLSTIIVGSENLHSFQTKEEYLQEMREENRKFSAEPAADFLDE